MKKIAMKTSLIFLPSVHCYITNQPAGRKTQIVYGSMMAPVNPEQIIEVLKYN
jgi:hypothetical protein